MRTHTPAFTAILAGLLMYSCCRSAAAQSLFNHSEGGRTTRLWIPPEADVVRGILIVGNGAGGDSTSAASNRTYRRFGEIHDFAVMGTGFWGNLSGDSEIALWEDHLDALSASSGHPELVHAPWAPIGLSNGGQMSYGFNALRPEKVIAFIANKGCCYNDRSPSEAALQTPGLLIAGELDTDVRRDSIRGLFEENRPRGALWSWIEEENTGHASTADQFVLPFMSEAIRLRYPAGELPTATDGVVLHALHEHDGWLADQSTWRSALVDISSYLDYDGDRSMAGWLLNENMAQLYRAFATYDKPVALRIPALALGESLGEQFPLPVQVRVQTSISDWTKVELFDYAEKIGEVTSGGDPMRTTVVPTLLSPGRVHALTALVTHGDGVTVSTSNVAAVLTAPVPEPPSATILLGVAASAVVGRRRCVRCGHERNQFPVPSCPICPVRHTPMPLTR
jgi:hypothetical protein